MKQIEIRTIPHKEQRYPTCGDYFEDGETVHFRISQLPDWRFEFLILVHELVEYAAVKHAGIDIKSIDEFDMGFEANRIKGNTDEPGDDLRAPYYKQHQLATLIERMVAFALGVNWNHYDQIVGDL